MNRMVLAVSACALSGAILAPSAMAAPDDFTCRGSAARVAAPVLNGSIEPSVANAANDPCASESKTLVPISIPQNTGTLVKAPTSNAKTTRTADAATTYSSINNSTVNVGSIAGLSADVIEANAASTCTNGSPALTGSSRIVGAKLKVLGLSYSIPLNPAPNTTLVNLGSILKVVLNEQATAGGQRTVRAIHISSALLSTDIVLAEARAGSKGSPCGPPAPPACSDTQDNDGDGLPDSLDPGCHTDGDPNNPDSYDPTDDNEYDAPLPECSNGKDDDLDGNIDFPADPGCSSGLDDSESPDPKVPECSNGKDDDGDGAADFPNDPGCSSKDDDSESPDPK